MAKLPAPDLPSGIDVSHLQGNVEWQKIAEAGIKFAFIKATEGATFADPNFKANWEGARMAGLLRGAYHFFHPETEALAQAERFLSVVGKDSGELAPALDLEPIPVEGTTRDRWSNASADARLLAISTWLDAVEQSLGRKPIIYTAAGFWNKRISAGNRFAAYPLWLAQYTKTIPPRIPSTWTDWSFWQHSDSGRVPGISGKVDISRFNGSLDDLRELAESGRTRTGDIISA